MLDYISIASLNQYIFCPHRWWRMTCAGDFLDNEYTIEGTSLHDRVHNLSQEIDEDIYQVRAIWLRSDQYQLIGKSDLIESNSGEIYPVEYKRGKRGEWDNDEIQVCAQALCLEEMTGKTIETGYIYYAQSHHRQEVSLNETLRNMTLDTIQSIRTLLENQTRPQPVYKPRCKGCSLYSHCLPQAQKKVNKYQEEL
jgi:CRISPR-associated exonuclease Cas4